MHFHSALVTDTLFPLSLKPSKCRSMLKKMHVDNKKAIDRAAVLLEQLSNKKARRQTAFQHKCSCECE